MRKKQIHDRGLTARELLKLTPAYIKYRGDGYIKILKADRKVDKRGQTRFETVTRTNILGEAPRKHKQTINLLGGAKKIGDHGARIKVTCDCEHHAYHCEVALSRYGASDIIHSNGEFPFVTNPRGIPYLCKHLYVLVVKLVKTQ